MFFTRGTESFLVFGLQRDCRHHVREETPRDVFAGFIRDRSKLGENGLFWKFRQPSS